MNEVIIVSTTFDNPDAAQQMARDLVEARLAACVQILGPISSTYRWQNKTETAAEYLALIKTRAELFPALEQFIRAHHSYETPEILATPATAISESYLSWLVTETDLSS